MAFPKTYSTLKEAAADCAKLRESGWPTALVVNDGDGPLWFIRVGDSFLLDERIRTHPNCEKITLPCAHYLNNDWRTRCPNLAAVWLYGPDGRHVPGGFLCAEHAEIEITEFRDKLGETWFALPLEGAV